MRYVLGHLGGTCAIALLVAGLTISNHAGVRGATGAFEAVATLCWYIAWCHLTWLPVSASSSSLSFRRQRILRLLLSRGVAPARRPPPSSRSGTPAPTETLMRFPKPYSVQCNTRAEHQSTTRDTPLHDRYIALPPSLASVRTLTHSRR